MFVLSYFNGYQLCRVLIEVEIKLLIFAFLVINFRNSTVCKISFMENVSMAIITRLIRLSSTTNDKVGMIQVAVENQETSGGLRRTQEAFKGIRKTRRGPGWPKRRLSEGPEGLGRLERTSKRLGRA